jgi:hypothetical protein
MSIRTSPFPSENLVATEIDQKKTWIIPDISSLKRAVTGEDLHPPEGIVFK